MHRLRLLAASACAVAALGCGGSDASGGCDHAEREGLDPAFVQHVVPGGPAPEYLSDPPTSGPHQASPEVSGSLDEPISKPVQVGLLEAGTVLVQYRDDSVRADAEALAGDGIVVAPNPELDDEVVATAWTWKLTCSSVDSDAITDFADAHADAAPGGD